MFAKKSPSGQDYILLYIYITQLVGPSVFSQPSLPACICIYTCITISVYALAGWFIYIYIYILVAFAGCRGGLLCDAFTGNTSCDLEALRGRFSIEANVLMLEAGDVPGGFSKNGQPSDA